MYLDPSVLDRPPITASRLPHLAEARQAERPEPAPQPTETEASPEAESFTRHLLNAIATNVNRAPGYAHRSHGWSWPISLRLIACEVILLPSALIYDASSQPFLGRGIPVITGDFTSMTLIRPASLTLGRQTTVPDGAWQELRQLTVFYQGMIDLAAQARDFQLIGQACHEMMGTLDRFEETAGAQATMTRHVVESVGMSAVHALEAKARSRGESDGLYGSFLGFQSVGLIAAYDIDVAAHPLHVEGIGILTNDVPVIPFPEAWQAWRQSQPGR